MCCCHSAIFSFSLPPRSSSSFYFVDLIFAQWLCLKECHRCCLFFGFKIEMYKMNVQNRTVYGFSLSTRNGIQQLKSIKVLVFLAILMALHQVAICYSNDVNDERRKILNTKMKKIPGDTSTETQNRRMCVSNNYDVSFFVSVFSRQTSINIFMILFEFSFVLFSLLLRSVVLFLFGLGCCGRNLIASLFIYVRWMHIIHKYLRNNFVLAFLVVVVVVIFSFVCLCVTEKYSVYEWQTVEIMIYCGQMNRICCSAKLDKNEENSNEWDSDRG